MTKNPKILMIGPGAIGGTTAALIAKAGYDITIVANREETTKQIKETGIKITGILGNHLVKMKAVTKITDLRGYFDLVFIATKAYDMPKVARKILPYINKNSLIVSMQNGICTEQLAVIVGEQRTVGCVIGFGATMVERGHLHITSYGSFIIGSIAKENRPDLSIIQNILKNVFPTMISDDIFSHLYSKLIINSCITSLGAICGLKLGAMLKIKTARNIFIAIVKEAIIVADAANIKVPPYANKIDYYKLVKGTTICSNFRRHLIIKMVGQKYKNLKSSSLQSLERGQLTEIDYFNGYIVSKGEEYGINTPVNFQLINMIKQIENKKLDIKVDNLYKIQL